MEEEDDPTARRLVLLAQEWAELANRLGFLPARVRLNYDLLNVVVQSFFRDLTRFKKDHGIGRADRHKSAGFMLYWICRVKPVQLLVFKEEDSALEPLSEHELLANEIFGISAAFAALDVRPDLEEDYNFFDSLLQRLRERDCPPEFAASMVFLYEEMTKHRAQAN